MKNIILILLTSVAFSINAQEINPFESIGKEGKILTLSKGKYTEVHINDSLQRIGSVIINMNTGTIYELLNTDTLYSEATLDPTVISRWYSPDPLESRYPGSSPYVFAGNNPIMFIDPDGRAIKPASSGGYSLMAAAFNSFGLNDPQSLFGNFETTNRDGKGEVIRTYLGEKSFKRRLRRTARRNNWDKEQKNRAKVMYKVLSSPEIIEIGSVSVHTEANMDGQGGGSTDSDVEVGTENSEARSLLVNNSLGKINQTELTNELKESNGKLYQDGSSFGFFQDEGVDTSTDGFISRSNSIGNYYGLLLINVPTVEGENTYDFNDNNQQSTQIFIDLFFDGMEGLNPASTPEDHQVEDGQKREGKGDLRMR
ncbi:MAG: hypothetical protein COA32_10140 [Fluviicola sp.]|nr:MAG: hypothetical protein COA32_10140 [Fluviicola sp.]